MNDFDQVRHGVLQRVQQVGRSRGEKADDLFYVLLVTPTRARGSGPSTLSAREQSKEEYLRVM